jgi:hypothetical protein
MKMFSIKKLISLCFIINVLIVSSFRAQELAESDHKWLADNSTAIVVGYVEESTGIYPKRGKLPETENPDGTFTVELPSFDDVLGYSYRVRLEETWKGDLTPGTYINIFTPGSRSIMHFAPRITTEKTFLLFLKPTEIKDEYRNATILKDEREAFDPTSHHMLVNSTYGVVEDTTEIAKIKKIINPSSVRTSPVVKASPPPTPTPSPTSAQACSNADKANCQEEGGKWDDKTCTCKPKNCKGCPAPK